MTNWNPIEVKAMLEQALADLDEPDASYEDTAHELMARFDITPKGEPGIMDQMNAECR